MVDRSRVARSLAVRRGGRDRALRVGRGPAALRAGGRVGRNELALAGSLRGAGARGGPAAPAGGSLRLRRGAQRGPHAVRLLAPPLEPAAALHPDGGPDILEVPDYQAEGFAAAHARRGLDPRLRSTKLVVRLSTSAEMCARLNEDPDDLHLRVLSGVERFPLRFADVILWPGGNALERYVELYGEDGLAPAIECPLPMADDLDVSSSSEPPPADGPLRLLYLNRLERRKGVAELVTAVRSLPDADLALTLVGRDTQTGPDGRSMRAHVSRLAGGDPRIELLEQVPHSEVPRLIAEHHAVVVPTRWETFSYVVREALACNRPVVATPAGGIVDVVRPGESGWLAGSSSPEALAATLREVLDRRGLITQMVAEGRPRRVFEEGSAAERNLEVYAEIRERGGEAGGGPATPGWTPWSPASPAAAIRCRRCFRWSASRAHRSRSSS